MKLIDVSAPMRRFKEACRNLWNTYFQDQGLHPANERAFLQAERALFNSIVLLNFGLSHRADELREGPLSFLVVRPAPSISELSLLALNESVVGYSKWDALKWTGKYQDLRLAFYDFFDWNPSGYVDLPYVRGRVFYADSSTLLGRIVLIEHLHCEFFLDGDAGSLNSE